MMDPTLLDGLDEALRRFPRSVDLAASVVSLLLAAGVAQDAATMRRPALARVLDDVRLRELLNERLRDGTAAGAPGWSKHGERVESDPSLVTLSALACAVRICQSVPDAFAPLTVTRGEADSPDIREIDSWVSLARWMIRRLIARLRAAESAKDDAAGRSLASGLMELLTQVQLHVDGLGTVGGPGRPFDHSDVLDALVAAFRVGPNAASGVIGSFELSWDTEWGQGSFEPFAWPWPDVLSALVTKLVVAFEAEESAPGAWQEGAYVATLDALVHLVDRIGHSYPDWNYREWDDDSVLGEVLWLAANSGGEWRDGSVRGVSATEDASGLAWATLDCAGRELLFDEAYADVRLRMLLRGSDDARPAPSRLPRGLEVPVVDASTLVDALAGSLPTFASGSSVLVLRAEQLGPDLPFRGTLGFWSASLSADGSVSRADTFPVDTRELAYEPASRASLAVAHVLPFTAPCARRSGSDGPKGLPDLPQMIARFAARGLAVQWLRAAGTLGSRGLRLRLEVGVRDSAGFLMSSRLRWSDGWLDGDLILVRSATDVLADLDRFLEDGDLPGVDLHTERAVDYPQPAQARVLRLGDIPPTPRRTEVRPSTTSAALSVGELLRERLQVTGRLPPDTALVILDEDRAALRPSYEHLSRM